MRNKIIALAGAALLASPALAQDADDTGFSGFYVGGAVGAAVQNNDNLAAGIQFDRNLDGTFGDTVTTTTGANAFSPGFCGGTALGARPENGCKSDKINVEYMGRVGFDVQRGSLVFGVVGEGGRTEIHDRSTAYSTTPAYYTLDRSLRYNGNLRARIGFTPDSKTLFYATGGGAYGRLRTGITSSNVTNSYTTSGNTDAFGYAVGGGLERKFTRNISVGIEYLMTDLYDDRGRVRVGAGSAPATNPFLLAGAGGTDFRRGDRHFRWHGIRGVVNFRF